MYFNTSFAGLVIVILRAESFHAIVSDLENNVSNFEDVGFFCVFLSFCVCTYFCKLLPTLTTCLQVSFQYNFEKAK